MHQVDERYGLATQQPQVNQIIQVGDRVYQLTEIPTQPVAINPQPVQTIAPVPAPAPSSPPVQYQQHPTPVYPQALPEQESFWASWQNVVLLGTGLLIVTGFGTYLVVRAALPPAAAPVAIPPAPAPAPAPQTVIVQPPPPPPPTPYRRTDCKPAGIFGGEVCSTEEGFIR